MSTAFEHASSDQPSLPILPGLNVVLGATGGIGGAVVRELAANGARVRAVSRKPAADLPAGVEAVAGDVANLDDARRACAGAAVVYMCANPPYHRWATDFPPLLAGAIEGARSAGGRLLFADNLYSYAPTREPISETSRVAPITKKGAVRKRMAEDLLAAHAAGTVRAAIVRGSDYFGPDAPNTAVGDRFFYQVLGRKPVQWMARLDQPHSVTYTRDFARALITVAAHDEALGQVWHVPAAEPLTGRQYIALAAQIAGVRARPTAVPTLALRALGLFNPALGEMVEMQYEFAEPYILDGTKMRRAFGFVPTPHAEAFAATLAWYRAHPAPSTGHK